jgi:hypothetical protein
MLNKVSQVQFSFVSGMSKIGWPTKNLCREAAEVLSKDGLSG